MRRSERRRRQRWAIGLLLPIFVAALVAAACGTNDDEEGAEATLPPPLESTATEAPGPDIEQVDLSQVPAVEDLVSDTGGELLPEETLFADLTGDGADEAVVPISSGGSGGNVAYAVLGYRDGDLEEILAVKPEPEAGRVTMAVEGGVLVETQPVYGPEDPLCCPSQLQHTYYRWDGEDLVVDHQETETAPSVKP